MLFKVVKNACDYFPSIYGTDINPINNYNKEFYNYLPDKGG